MFFDEQGAAYIFARKWRSQKPALLQGETDSWTSFDKIVTKAAILLS
jgi:hypothetical protein